MIFQSLMGLKNQGMTVPSGTTQGNSYPCEFCGDSRISDG